MLNKPKQYKTLHKDADNDILLGELETALYGISDAMEALAGYKDFADWFDALSDLWDEMQPMHDECENVAAAEYAKEVDDLTRDYYRSVL